MDALTGLCCLHWCRNIFPNATINRNTIARENCFWCLFPRSHYLLRIFIRISHPVLSFGNCWQTIFQVSVLRAISSPIRVQIACNYVDPKLLYLIFRLDYCGIALLIMGSFVPWLYYGFYCHYEHKLVYLSVVLVLGVSSIFVSLYDKFSEPNLRPLRAGTMNQMPQF